jgi:hypothetical protein
MNAREHIERMMTNRLLRKMEDDIEVNEIAFNKVMQDMDKMILNILGETKIPGFTNEDLKSFFTLKTHQMLRRRKWDQDRLPFGLFSISYRNLVRDIIRMRGRALKNGMSEDGLDYYIEFDESLGQRKHIRTHWKDLSKHTKD